MSNKGSSSDAPANWPGNASFLHDDDAPHRSARLTEYIHIECDTSRRDARHAPATVAPTGTITDPVGGGELLRGPLFEDWAVASRMCLTCNDLLIADERPDVYLALSLEICATTSAMIADIQ